MSDVTVRPAVPADYQRIGELTVLAYTTAGYLDDPGGGEYAALLRDVASRARHAEVLAAVNADGDVIGSVTVVRPDTQYAEVARDGEVEFRMLAVDPAGTRRGVGEALTCAVVDRARALGARRVVLSSLVQMATAHRLYTRLGFSRLPERDWGLRYVSMLAFAMELDGAETPG